MARTKAYGYHLARACNALQAADDLSRGQDGEISYADLSDDQIESIFAYSSMATAHIQVAVELRTREES